MSWLDIILFVAAIPFYFMGLLIALAVTGIVLIVFFKCVRA